jgi:hypothetical protein
VNWGRRHVIVVEPAGRLHRQLIVVEPARLAAPPPVRCLNARDLARLTGEVEDSDRSDPADRASAAGCAMDRTFRGGNGNSSQPAGRTIDRETKRTTSRSICDRSNVLRGYEV